MTSEVPHAKPHVMYLVVGERDITTLKTFNKKERGYTVVIFHVNG